MAQIISGKEISAQIRSELAEETKKLKEETGITPGLAVVIVGEDPASQIYVRNKNRSCLEIGMHSEVHALPADTTANELLALIDKLNKDDSIHGILVQLPLPRHLDESLIINSISPEKDVDAFHPVNVGKLTLGEDGFLPCTPAGVVEMLKRSDIEITGKKCVVIGRSNIVGKPAALLLLRENGTVTVCHSRTKNLKEVCLDADILVASIGKANFITADMIKPGAVVIDVGINRLENGKITGDVDFAEAEKIASAITPVPGGVGPMTITMLLKNTLVSAKRAADKKNS